MAYAEAQKRPRRAPPNVLADASHVGWYPFGEDAADVDMFLGRLVTICGIGCDQMDSRMDWLASGLSTLQGVKGKAMEKDADGEYVIVTFTSKAFKVPEANLRILERELPEQGGFDVPYPASCEFDDDGSLRVVTDAGPACAAFAHEAVRNLITKGYCMIQMFDSDELQSDMATLADQTTDYVSPKAEFVEALLGSGTAAKVMWLRPSRGNDAWSSYDARFDELANLLYDQAELNFNPSDARLASLLRRSFEGEWEQEYLAPTPISEQDIQAGLVEQHLDFVQRRKICCMYFISGDGGTIDLYPRSEDQATDFRPTTLPTENGKLLIFRHDVMSFCYMPNGEDLVLQTWLAEEPCGIELGEIRADSELEVSKFKGVEQGPEQSYQSHLMAMSLCWGWNVNNPTELWASWMQGVDSALLVPTIRCDEEHTEDMLKHCCWLDDSRLLDFDYSFFGIDEKDKDFTQWSIDHQNRLCLECAAECFHNAGYTLESLRNQYIANYTGELKIYKTQDAGKYYFCSRDDSLDFWRDASMNIMYFFGLKGPCTSLDTACSSALVATACAVDFVKRRLMIDGIPSVGLVGAANIMLLHLRPGAELVNSSMMSYKGRSFTFDQSANGYARGEGASFGLVAGSSEQKDIADRLASILAVTIGQDGKSASLTAPSGTAQQECYRVNLRTAKLQAEEVGYTECHGTGTALGDPVESGGLLQVFKKRGTAQFTGTHKTNFGHLETGAGLVGLYAAVLQTMNATWKPHNHIRQLNNNCDMTGYPCHVNYEQADPGEERVVCGVSSFGFGGTNSRADIWNWARGGHRKISKSICLDKLDYIAVPCPRCLGPMCWLCGVAVSKLRGRRDHRCEAVRADSANYEYCSNCYKGEYSYAEVLCEPEDTGEPLHILGTWTGWTTFEAMERIAPGTYKFDITLGETLWAKFCLAVNKDPKRQIYPVVDKADQLAQILGADAENPGNSWFIDARGENLQPGAVYQVEFRWGELDQARAISWKLVSSSAEVPQSEAFEHTYSLTGPGNSWSFIDMARGVSTRMWWVTFAIGQAGEEAFQVVRDRDLRQALYPSDPLALDTTTVAGPDDDGTKGHLWRVRGKPGESVTVTVSLSDEGVFAIGMESKTLGKVQWTSAPRRNSPRYHLISSFDGWSEGVEMQADVETPTTYRGLLVVGATCSEEFQIVDADRPLDRVMYPRTHRAYPGEEFVCGPGEADCKLCWQIMGRPGQYVEIVLNCKAQDHRKKVTCRILD